MARVRSVRIICAVALAAAAATCGDSKTPTFPGPNNPGATCRTYPTTATVATTSSGVTINGQLTGAFDTSAKRSTVANLFSVGGLCSTTVTNYNSVADFVDEVGVIPGVTLATSNTTTNAAFCGSGTQSVTFSYDSQRRLTKFTSAGGTTSYTAWDSSGRPTTGSTNGISISNVYDNTARTLTQTQVAPGGAQTLTVITYDANGNQISSVVTTGSGTTTTTFVNTATATVCK